MRSAVIKIEKVINKNDLKAFIAFPHHFIPTIQTGYPLYSLNAARFVYEESGDGPYHLAGVGGKKAGQIVGRITAQIDTLHRERTVKIPVISA